MLECYSLGDYLSSPGMAMRVINTLTPPEESGTKRRDDSPTR
jgi:hypothetical protein